jgi:hypothetical protein
MGFELWVQTGEKDSSVVEVKVRTGLSCTRNVMAFSFDTGSQFAAELIAAHIRDSLNGKVNAMLETAYNAGWKDKSRHFTKRTAFRSQLTDGPVVFPTREGE